MVTGCAPLYLPAPHNTPMFTGKDQIQLLAGIGSNGFSARPAYAISNHLAVSTSLNYFREKDKISGIFNRSGEAAVGYYTNFGDRWCFEWFGGFGFSKSRVYDSTYNFIFWDNVYQAKGKFGNVYTQPSFGMNQGRLAWNFSVKINYLRFPNVSIIHNGESIARGVLGQAFVEPAFNFRVSLFKEKIFWTYQLGASAHVPGNVSPRFDYVMLMTSTGFVLQLGSKTKKQTYKMN